MKQTLSLLLVLSLMLLSACAPAAKEEAQDPLTEVQLSAGDYRLRTAVLACGEPEGNLYDYLAQPLLVDLTAEQVNWTAGTDLSGYEILYLDGSVKSTPDKDALVSAVTDFVRQGGAVYLDNALFDFFPADFIGASSFVKVEGCPVFPELPAVEEDLQPIQEVIGDFAKLYASFADYETVLSGLDYGYAAVTDTAVSLANWQGSALYTMNRYGEGLVFFTNPLLPNTYNLSNFSLESEDENAAFSSTTASCSQLLVNRFAAYISKTLYGYALTRVYGTFGTPSMSWELHYEEITGFENNSMELFTELCKEYQQIPSFTVIRSSYWWFLRAESVTYLLNQGTNTDLSFAMDYDESAYSSGTHVDCNGKWLTLSEIENGGSYFEDYPEFDYRAYPFLTDYDGDGKTDLFCGSQDGQIHYFHGAGFDGRLKVEEPVVLTDEKGKAISVTGYSAPQLVDLNGDGILDLAVGNGKGEVLWYEGDGTLSFDYQGVLLNADFPGQALPTFGDVDGDGVTDLLVGSDLGILMIYFGSQEGDALSFSQDRMAPLSKLCADDGMGDWLAPHLTDFNGDGALDLAVGTFDGYVALLKGHGDGSFVFCEYVDLEEQNYKGNHHAKFGNYCVPVFYDLDGDGNQDLLCGSLEYGMAYPIDSPYFPQAEALQEQMDYAKENHFYTGVHFYTNSYASPERESYELEAHKDALESYGVDLSRAGVNQHTWYTSCLSPAQSFLSAWNAGLLWNSGFGSPGASWNAPQYAAENVIALPFFLTQDGEETILIQNNSVLPYQSTEWTDLSAKYEMPVCIYFHCDFIYESEAQSADYAQKASDFQWTHGYNFNREDQLMLATAAARNLWVSVEEGTDSLTLTPGQLRDDFALYDADYQSSSGVKLEVSAQIDTSQWSVDADVWYREGNTFYLGLNRPVTLTFTGSGEETPHVRQVNVPAEITAQEDGAVISFRSDGMLQAVITGSASTSDEGWTVTEEKGNTVFTRYGDVAELHITFTGENQK